MSPESLYDFYSDVLDITVTTLKNHDCSYQLVDNDGSLEELRHTLEALLQEAKNQNVALQVTEDDQS